MELDGNIFEFVELLARGVLGTILLLAGSVKLASPGLLQRDIKAYRLLPNFPVHLVSFALPILEVVIGIFLVVGEMVRPIALVAGFLFTVFLLATASAFLRKLNVQCGCFGLLYRQKLGPSVVTRDALLLFSSIYLAVVHQHRLSLDGAVSEPFGGLHLLVLVLLLSSLTLARWAVLSSQRLEASSTP